MEGLDIGEHGCKLTVLIWIINKKSLMINKKSPPQRGFFYLSFYK